jgi:preprotein translocase subunit SecY
MGGMWPSPQLKPSNYDAPQIQPLEDSPQLFAKSGICYYMTPPHTLKAALTDPIHTLIYIGFITSACAVFSKTWIEVSGSGPRDIAKQLKDQQMVGVPRLPTTSTDFVIRSWLAIERAACIKSSSG